MRLTKDFVKAISNELETRLPHPRVSESGWLGSYEVDGYEYENYRMNLIKLLRRFGFRFIGRGAYREAFVNEALGSVIKIDRSFMPRYSGEPSIHSSGREALNYKQLAKEVKKRTGGVVTLAPTFALNMSVNIQEYIPGYTGDQCSVKNMDAYRRLARGIDVLWNVIGDMHPGNWVTPDFKKVVVIDIAA